MQNKTYLTEIVTALGIMSLLSAGVFGAFGAIVHYLYLVVKEIEEYRVSRKIALINYISGTDRTLLLRSENSGRMQIDTFDGSTTRSHGVSTSDTTSWHHFVGTTNTSKVLTT